MSLISTFSAGGAKKLPSAPLSSLDLGSIISIKENDAFQDFYISKHGYPSSGNGRTLLVRRYIHSDRPWTSSGANAYATSTLDAWFNGDYFNSLPADIQGQIAAVQIPYTLGNGTWTVTNLSRKVFALSGTELGQAQSYMNVEGTALADAATLKIATDSTGVAKNQWTRSPYKQAVDSACLVLAAGTLSYYNRTSNFGARPAFTLPSNMAVYMLYADHNIVVL